VSQGRRVADLKGDGQRLIIGDCHCDR
jgi:hypothetical protein